ncbi:MAG TPA: hypothetical protein VLM05_21950 [Mycobacteriales bacterium]|nr:hypothetical protein [Mycobacteriales bacterium]
MLLFLGATAAFNADEGGDALACYGFTAAVLLPVAIWLTVAISNSEDPVQRDVTAVTVGGAWKVGLARLLCAALVCVVLAVGALIWSPVAGNSDRPGWVVAGAAAHLITLTAGVAIGALLSRPVVSRLSRVVFGATAALLVELALPVPPLRPMLTLFDADHPTALGRPLTIIAVETLALSAALITLAHRLTHHHT